MAHHDLEIERYPPSGRAVAAVQGGAVHGDLHYDNVLLYQDDIRPIDFTELCLAHYLYDIGVTLYHI